MQGFIKIDRQITAWEWYNDPNTFRLFMHLLLKANHKTNKWQGVEIQHGQTITGRKKLAMELKLTERQIRTSLNKLKSTNEITIKSTNKYSIITICNWEYYQENKYKRRPTKQPAISQTRDQQTTTNKNEKHIKNNVINSIVEYLNTKSEKKFKSNTETTRSLIELRIKDGYTKEDFIKVIDNKCSRWINTEQEQYLRPQTLFGSKFESYLNEKYTNGSTKQELINPPNGLNR